MNNEVSNLKESLEKRHFSVVYLERFRDYAAMPLHAGWDKGFNVLTSGLKSYFQNLGLNKFNMVEVGAGPLATSTKKIFNLMGDSINEYSIVEIDTPCCDVWLPQSLFEANLSNRVKVVNQDCSKFISENSAPVNAFVGGFSLSELPPQVMNSFLANSFSTLEPGGIFAYVDECLPEGLQIKEAHLVHHGNVISKAIRDSIIFENKEYLTMAQLEALAYKSGVNGEGDFKISLKENLERLQFCGFKNVRAVRVYPIEGEFAFYNGTEVIKNFGILSSNSQVDIARAVWEKIWLKAANEFEKGNISEGNKILNESVSLFESRELFSVFENKLKKTGDTAGGVYVFFAEKP